MSFKVLSSNIADKHKFLDNSEIIGLDDSIKDQFTYEYNYFQIQVQHGKQNIIIHLNFDKLTYKDYYKYLAIFKIMKRRLDTSLTKNGDLYNEVNYKLPIKFECIPYEFLSKLELIDQMIDDLNETYINYNTYTAESGTKSDYLLAHSPELKNLTDFSLSDDVFITDYNRNYKANLLFILKLLFNCINSTIIDLIWKPKPEFLFEKIPQSGNPDYDLIDPKNEKLRKEEISNLYFIICKMSKFEYDSQIYAISPLCYIIIKFSITNFREFSLENWSITSLEEEEEEKKKEETDNSITSLRRNTKRNTNTACKGPKTNGAKFFKVTYEDEKKRKNTLNPGLDRLFHGSTNQNWFSIFFNGLTTGKGGLLMNGAAYGSGIYLSSNSSYSISYSQKHGDYSFVKQDTIFDTDHRDVNVLLNSYILGVFALLKPRKNFHRGGNIFVVPPSDEHNVMLEYLMMCPSSRGSVLSTKIDKYFVNDLGSEIIRQTTSVMKVGNKRIMGELKKLMKNNDTLDKDSGLHYVVHTDEKNMHLIRFDLPLDNFDDEDILKSDMIAHGHNKIEVEMILPERYPIEPPFVRLLRPRFEFRTGHITLGGSICMELLTNQGWTATTTMEKLLLIVKMNMAAGGARLDPARHNVPYSMSEAKEAYNRMLRSHGWDKKTKK